MDEIARELGISKTTVSRALSGKGRVGKETVERVQAFIQAHTAAEKLPQTRCLGVVIPSDSYTISMPYFHECLLGISSSAAMMGYNVMIVVETPGDIDNVCSLVEGGFVDGMILMRGVKDDPILKYLTDSRFPTGLTGQCGYSEVVQVDVDNAKATATMTSMLAGRGFRRLAIVVGNSNDAVNMDRVDGFREAAALQGISRDNCKVYTNFTSVDQMDSVIDACTIQKTECVICGDDGKMRAYPLFTYDPAGRDVETFYIEFDQGCRHSSDKHNDGVEEHIFVLRGTLRRVLGDKTVDVGERQAVRFRADMSHAYQNLTGSVCAVYNTIFYPSH